MSEKEHDMTNDGGESVTYTLRNIPADTDRVITDLASHARKPKATFLREFLGRQLPRRHRQLCPEEPAHRLPG
ncbi:hypothetical protein PSK87_29985 [Escherichia coli]|nr:hypothetical protein [Escherichia coli]